MTCFWLPWMIRRLRSLLSWRTASGLILMLFLVLSGVMTVNAAPALAGLTDDRYDGDIFALYAGNGSLVPPRFTLQQALKRQRPVLLVFYVDDSSDCKTYATTVSRFQEFYGRAADILAFRVDALPPQPNYSKTEAGYYYHGVVPQTVLFDAKGKIVLNEKGNLDFEQVDDVFREVFDLLPRSQSVALKRRPINEINTELVQP